MQKVLLVCKASKSLGIGHLLRIVRIAKALKVTLLFELKISIVGPKIQREDLEYFKHQFYLHDSSIERLVAAEVKNFQPEIIVFDLYSDKQNYSEMLYGLKQNNIKLIAIDGFIEFCKFIDLLWIPSFMKPKIDSRCFHKTRFGWNKYLLGGKVQASQWNPGKRILLLTGGSDPTELYKDLPNIIDCQISGYVVNWVQGPFSTSPNLKNLTNNTYNIIKSPQGLNGLIYSVNYILTVYGVSFFESCQYGRPISVFSPYGEKNHTELKAVSDKEIALSSCSAAAAVNNLKYLIDNVELSNRLAKNANNIVKDGTDDLVNEIINLSRI